MSHGPNVFPLSFRWNAATPSDRRPPSSSSLTVVVERLRRVRASSERERAYVNVFGVCVFVC